MVKRTLGADAVVHLRYASTPGAPWRGISPLAAASETRELAGWIERRLAEEARTPSAYVLPLPENRGDSDDLKADIKRGRGSLHIVDTTSGAWGAGSAQAPREDWKPSRLGANPPAIMATLRGDVRTDIFGAYGIPNSIFGSGGAAREAYRQFLASTIQPLSKIITEALSVSLDTPGLVLTFPDLAAADIQGRARAYAQLVNAGMDPAEAATLTGLGD